MKYEKKIESILKRARATMGVSLGEWWDEYDRLESVALALVKERISGHRKGLLDEMNYRHSVRVFETVKALHHWDDPDLDMFLAALLHDIVEDGGVSLTELAEMGFSRKTLELIFLCSHDVAVENKRERWMRMVAQLVRADNDEAWCIKLVDLADNLAQSHGLTPDNRAFMLEVKAPLMLQLTDNLGPYEHRYHAHLEAALEKAKRRRQR
jgi:(p)ppGpp synthase/HD superfamily hydrolase